MAIIGVCVGLCGFLFTTIKALREKRYIGLIKSHTCSFVTTRLIACVNHRTLQVATQDNQAYGVIRNKKLANTKQRNNTTTQPEAEYEVISF